MRAWEGVCGLRGPCQLRFLTASPFLRSRPFSVLFTVILRGDPPFLLLHRHKQAIEPSRMIVGVVQYMSLRPVQLFRLRSNGLDSLPDDVSTQDNSSFLRTLSSLVPCLSRQAISMSSIGIVDEYRLPSLPSPSRLVCPSLAMRPRGTNQPPFTLPPLPPSHSSVAIVNPSHVACSFSIPRITLLDTIIKARTNVISLPAC
ncbi:hypothetical protein LIA77_05778 [Sarocladium implicatum]|nr:hypothetical protein LIA77_05778 [Sarocladium implicatum]